MAEIILLDLFAGTGGFAKGLTDAGFTIKEHYFSEIDKHAIANYQYNFPNAKYLGPVEHVCRSKYPITPNIITFGWPCQDNSIAGKRKGQKHGTRSGLLFEAGRILHEFKPQHFIAENVKGLFSVNQGNDFYEAIRFLTYLNTDSPQYNVEMQLFNTAWFLPQNRERLYFAGHLAAAGSRRLFPIGENGELFNEAYNTTNRQSQTQHSTALRASGNLKADATFVASAFVNDHGNLRKIQQSTTIDANYHKGLDNHAQRTVISEQQILGYTRDENGTVTNYHTNTNTNTIHSSTGSGGSTDQFVLSNETVLIAKVSRTDEAKLLRKESIANGKDHTPFANKKIEFEESDTMNTITCATTKDNLLMVVKELDNKFRFFRNDDKKSGVQGYDIFKEDSINIDTIDNHSKNIIFQQRIRRLTEIECERLQGFPDNWTKYGIYEKQVWINKKLNTFEIVKGVHEIAKTNRYKLCGNAVTVAVVQCIATKLLQTFY